MINGKRYAWEDISVHLPIGQLLDIENIEYSDKQGVEATYGTGAMPRGYGMGNYSAEGKLTLKREEFLRLVDYGKTLGRSIYRLPPFPVSVSYANEDEAITTDRLKSVKFTETSTKAGQGDTSISVDLSLIILGGIAWNGLEPT